MADSTHASKEPPRQIKASMKPGALSIGRSWSAGRSLLQQLSKPLRDFLRTETGSAGLLLGAAVLAIGWANSPLSDSYESLWSTEISVRVGEAVLSKDLRHWINDGLMVPFFLVVGLEVRRELTMGELTDRGTSLIA